MNVSNKDQSSWLADLVHTHEQALVRYAQRLLGDLDRARDVVQDTFVKLCRESRTEVEPKLPAWLFTVCRNRALDVLKKENRMNSVGTDPLGGAASREPDQAQLAERKDDVRSALQHLAQLPDNQQEVIRLKLQNHLSYREISDVTGLSVSNVGYLLHVGLRSLRERLGTQISANEA